MNDSKEFLDRVLPHSLELEQAVLGAILVDSESALPVAQEIITVNTFYHRTHQLIFTQMLRLAQKGIHPEPMSVVESLQQQELLGRANGEIYIYALTASVPDSSAVETHCKVLREKAILRGIIKACNAAQKSSYEGAGPQTVLNELDSEVTRLMLGVDRIEFTTAKEAADSFIATCFEERDGELVRRPGLDTGFIDLDRRLGGLQKGDLVIVASRPGTGKTAFILNAARHVAERGIPVGIISLEMSGEQLSSRLLAMTSEIPLSGMRGSLSREEAEKLTMAGQRLQNLPLYLDDAPKLSPLQLRSHIRKLVAQKGVQLVVIDYLGLVQPEDGRKSAYEQVTEVSRYFKNLARELNIPIIAVHQLNRECENRRGGRPRLHDLRDSGQLEQDADIVILLHNASRWERRQKADEITLDDEHAEICFGDTLIVDVAKFRNGEPGECRLLFQGATMQLLDKEPEEHKTGGLTYD